MPDRSELTAFVAAIPDLTSHRFVDTDGGLSLKLHSEQEVAERVVEALLAKYAVVERVQVGDNIYAQTPEQAAAVNRFIETGGID